MSKYSEIEIQTANNLLKEGYKWIVRENCGIVYAYKNKPRKNYCRNKGGDTWHYDAYDFICEKYVPIFQSITCDDAEPISLESIVHPQILDDAEKRYLSAVIRPFRNKVLYIRKSGSVEGMNEEYISIHLIKYDISCLPNFKRGTMYKGMEIDRQYTLEELGL